MFTELLMHSYNILLKRYFNEHDFHSCLSQRFSLTLFINFLSKVSFQ